MQCSLPGGHISICNLSHDHHPRLTASLQGHCIGKRAAMAGGFDKVPAPLAALRGGYANVLVTDAATGAGILRADGVTSLESKLSQRQKSTPVVNSYRTHVKKFLNADPQGADDRRHRLVAREDKEGRRGGAGNSWSSRWPERLATSA